MRVHGSRSDDLRPVTISTGVNKYAEGSVLIAMGDTRVLCTASVEEAVPPFRRGSGAGWVTAEYGMLPRATGTRNVRAAARGRLGGRTQEIQRLIGRSLRAVIDMTQLGERTIWLDCDVLQADGGTRTASITGAYVALRMALQHLVQQGALSSVPLTDAVAAVSLGIFQGVPYLDLNYEEDSTSVVDLNIVIPVRVALVEIQATAEQHLLPQMVLFEMLPLA